MALSKTVTTAANAASAPADTKPADQSNPFADYNLGDGSDQKKDGHAVFEEVTNPNSKEQATLYKFGNQARDNFNKEAYEDAKQNGYNKNFQEGNNLPTEGANADWNGMDWDETQRLTRLADAYNNRHRLQPGQLGMAGEGMTMNQFNKNDAIETQEMRRNALTQQGLAQQQSYALGRANDVLSYPQRLTEQFDKMGMDADAAAMEIQRNFADYAQRAQYDEKFRAEYDQALQKSMAYWTQHFAVYMKSEVGSVLYNEIKNNPGYAQWLATQLTNYPTPDGQQYLAQMIEAQITRSGFIDNMSPEQIYAEVQAILGRLTGYTSWSDNYWTAQTGKQSLAGAAAGYTGRK